MNNEVDFTKTALELLAGSGQSALKLFYGGLTEPQRAFFAGILELLTENELSLPEIEDCVRLLRFVPIGQPLFAILSTIKEINE